MNVTDLIDVTVLREINASLADTLGVSVMVVDANNVPVTESGEPLKDTTVGAAGTHLCECLSTGGADNNHDPQHCVAIPLRIGDTPIGALHIECIRCEDASGVGILESSDASTRTQEEERRDAVDAQVRVPCTHELTARLVSLLATAMADAESASPGALDQAGKSAAAVLSEAADHRALQQIADDLPIGLLCVDRHGEITWSNEPAKELFGFSPHVIRETMDRATVCTVASVEGADPVDYYVSITRQLARGRTVRNIRCLLCRQDGSALELRVDAAPTFTRNHRIGYVLLTLQPVDGEVDPAQDGSQPSWTDVRSMLYVVNTRAAMKQAFVAQELQSGVVEELQCAWLELDSLRQEMREVDQPGLSGCLASLASYLQRAAANAVTLRSECWPDVWDESGLDSRMSRDLPA